MFYVILFGFYLQLQSILRCIIGSQVLKDYEGRGEAGSSVT